MIEFVWWPLLFLLPLPLIIRAILPARQQQEQVALRTPYFNQWLRLYEDNRGQRQRKILQFLMLLIAWICLVLAAAKPQYVGEPIELPASGRDLLLAVDISGSMEATDLSLEGQKATRLDVVKSVLNDFIERREGDRIGLILFGEQAYLQTPLTFDRETVKRMLDESAIGLAGASRTAIGDGIGLAVKRLRERQADSRVLVLLTDGQNNTGSVDPIKAAQLASQIDVKIYTVGVGAERMEVDSFFGKRVLNPSKDLDEKTLIQVAEETNGQYFRARDTKELESIYAVLDEIEPVEDNPETFRPVKSLFFWPLGVALILTLLLGLIKWLESGALSRSRSTRSADAVEMNS